MTDLIQTRYVMVTRPKPQGEELCRLLQQNQLNPVYVPTLEFREPKDLSAYEQSLDQVSHQDWLIFTSPQAVNATIEKIQKKLALSNAQPQLAAIGAGTAQLLQQAGYQNILYPRQWHSEGLLALTPFLSVQNQKIAIIRGEDGRMVLEKSLKERGAQVLSIVSYRRVVPTLDVTEHKLLLTQKRIGVIICASFQAVSNLKILFGQVAWANVNRVPLLVVSERIKILAADLGFQTIWVARDASHQSILQTLMKHRSSIC